MFRHAGIYDYFSFRDERATFKNQVIINSEDTYFLIYGPDDYEKFGERIENAIADRGGKIIYRGPKAINKNYDWDEARNTLIIFEFDEPVQV